MIAIPQISEIAGEISKTFKRNCVHLLVRSHENQALGVQLIFRKSTQVIFIHIANIASTSTGLDIT